MINYFNDDFSIFQLLKASQFSARGVVQVAWQVFRRRVKAPRLSSVQDLRTRSGSLLEIEI